MILDKQGILSKAQAITDAGEISENVIKLTAADYAAPTDLWWVVDTAVAAATAGTLKFALVASTSAALTTSIEIDSVLVAAITEARVATAGKQIHKVNIGKTLKDSIGSLGDTYIYIGMKNTLSTGTTISINASLSPTEPHSEYHKPVVTSNVGVPTQASAGS